MVTTTYWLCERTQAFMVDRDLYFRDSANQLVCRKCGELWSVCNSRKCPSARVVQEFIMHLRHEHPYPFTPAYKPARCPSFQKAINKAFDTMVLEGGAFGRLRSVTYRTDYLTVPAPVSFAIDTESEIIQKSMLVLAPDGSVHVLTAYVPPRPVSRETDATSYMLNLLNEVDRLKNEVKHAVATVKERDARIAELTRPPAKRFWQ